jgi:hypothetical protein
MIGALKVIGGVLAALVLLGIAVWVSHDWDPKSGIDPLYVILALGAVALAFPAPREWLRNVTKISLGGIEVTRQVEDAVAAASALPVTDEDADTESRRKFKIIGEDWRKDPGGTLATLQVKLDERLHWLEREIYATHISSGTKTIEKLRASGLIRPFEARLANAVKEVSPKTIERDMNGGGETKEAAIRFIERADRVVHQIRLIAFDALVRRELEARGMRIVDIHGQPRGRWPDFYAFDPCDAEKQERKPLRISVRMARTKDSNLLGDTRERLKNRWPETPFDHNVQRVIVYPETAVTPAKGDADIPALKYGAFLEALDDYLQEPIPSSAPA